MSYPIYQTFKEHPNHNSRHLDTFTDHDKAVESADTLHDPDWGPGQHITVYRFDDAEDCGILEHRTTK